MLGGLLGGLFGGGGAPAPMEMGSIYVGSKVVGSGSASTAQGPGAAGAPPTSAATGNDITLWIVAGVAGVLMLVLIFVPGRKRKGKK
ncbi:hypothetical protein OpiT1DRAFT_04747 [Opitutaceae bacterium TAV1]|nr:hypothetical protein OpiT1DRAFT_04747 [Opitutaceae bacterium TAV1]